eukprot:CAMPEP_0181200294 /NCGR_PEP_ID=MMETSP1096-20121128/17680_1 /TAXON_ID=156174 ORGANISM="Chrysochromulina ericina, Strain CCMP281" /NCGR_SAMPLE_ID=MMETSP1096 /ASSEMBLY_ACC=CAM_ASM_000453 /LENGTH=221 /DNA_ID=CAMNT_0023290627 /DNA_START=42 /DNA_END=707 /DNA_ORIENTATION=+
MDGPGGWERDGTGPMDQEAINRDVAAYQLPPATPEQLARHLPDWAASFMLDDEAQDSYERERSTEAAAAYRAVAGRSWEALDAGDGSAEGDDSAGLSAFTPEEVAEDYGLPLETVVMELGHLGIDLSTVRPSESPIRSFCSTQQIKDLLQFVATTDPIAAREALADSTLEELSAEQPLSAEALSDLCEQHGIPLVLGVQTRLPTVDFAALVAYAEREAAFL